MMTTTDNPVRSDLHPLSLLARGHAKSFGQALAMRDAGAEIEQRQAQLTGETACADALATDRRRTARARTIYRQQLATAERLASESMRAEGLDDYAAALDSGCYERLAW